MPIYEYTCEACKNQFEHLAKSMTQSEKAKCPKCGSKRTSRAMSVFAVASAAAKPSEQLSPCARCGGQGPCALD